MASRPVSTYNPSALAPGKWPPHVPGPGLEDHNMGVFPDGAGRAPREYLVHLLTHTHPSLQIQHKPREVQLCQATERARDEPRLECLPQLALPLLHPPHFQGWERVLFATAGLASHSTPSLDFPFLGPSFPSPVSMGWVWGPKEKETQAAHSPASHMPYSTPRLC